MRVVSCLTVVVRCLLFVACCLSFGVRWLFVVEFVFSVVCCALSIVWSCLFCGVLCCLLLYAI